MVRPQKKRIVAFNPEVCYFKPRGIPLIDLDEVCLTVDEREAIRLADLQNLTHEEAGRRMGVSRATFGRIVQKARRTVADALINGKAINVEGGRYRLGEDRRIFRCPDCDHRWEEPFGSGRPDGCPACDRMNFYRTTREREA
jgi:predicted DNA-binding protein (UPF0251 family)